jgi:hypothetical protein
LILFNLTQINETVHTCQDRREDQFSKEVLMQFLNLILIILFGGAAMLALLAAVHLLLPRPVENARAILEGRMGRVFLLGLVNLIFFGAVIIVLVWLANLIRNNWSGLAGILGLIALVILLALGVFALNGLAGLTTLLGTRIGPAKSPMWSDLRGGLLLVLACLTPYIGWFVFTPFVLSLGLGASILALFRRKALSPMPES